MSTVALRGTLEQNSSTGKWSWKGVWAFGACISVAETPSQKQPQQPFEYTWETATDPSEIAIASIHLPEDIQIYFDTIAAESEAAAAAAAQQQQSKNSGKNKSKNKTKTGSGKNQQQTKTEKKGNDTEIKDDGNAEIKIKYNNDDGEEEGDDEHYDETANTKALAYGYSYAAVPEGHPPFTDAAKHYPDKKCPVSGQWKGYFQNVTGRKKDRTQKVHEEFYMFLNATPGSDVDNDQHHQQQKMKKFFFDDTPLPPTIANSKCLVLVRGMGRNPFGTFELTGYLDLESHVLEIQRQYVFLGAIIAEAPTSDGSKTNRKSSSPRNRNTPVMTRHKSSRPYFTRKRQPSWKRKQEPDETSPVRRPKKRSKSADGSVLLDPTILSPMTPTNNMAITTTDGAANVATATSISAVSTAATSPIGDGIMDRSNQNVGNAVIPATPTAVVSMAIGKSPEGTTTTITTPVAAAAGAITTTITPMTHAIPAKGLRITAPSHARATSGGSAKRPTPRKRSSSTSSAALSVKSPHSPHLPPPPPLQPLPAPSAVPAPPATSILSPYLKLPPIGDPRKARWRAAHFLYYQRQDPEENHNHNPNTTTTTNGSNSNSNSAPNPRYVVYEGEMADSKREGRGICLYSNGMLYEGEWKRNKEHGRGKLMTADRRRVFYEGEFERGRMQGHGTYYYAQAENPNFNKDSATEENGDGIGSRYVGEFKENMRNGFGVYYLPDGSVYSGMWSQGMMSGRGVFTWPDNSVYEGDWKDGKRHGQGLLKTSDGFIYDGMWANNAMEGRGAAVYPNGQKYEGLFSNGRREGRGTMHFTNGAVYEGRFRDDAVDGQGTMKMSESLTVPPQNGNPQDKQDFMIPISFQSDITHIHTKAGFTAVGD